MELAEEDLAGKVYMARAGLFNDLDVCLDWHPDYENKANMQSSQAIADYTITSKEKVLMQQQIPGTVGAH
jgi:aminobenzoyl-glutamate utilization protein B